MLKTILPSLPRAVKINKIGVKIGGISKETTVARFCLRTLPRGGATRYADHSAAWRLSGVL